MKVIYEFACANGEPIEQFHPLGQAPDEIQCSEHNTIARRKIGAVDFIAFPGSYRRRERVGEPVMGEPE